MPHTDLILRALAELPDPVGSLVRAFPGRLAASEDTEWLDLWFVSQTAAVIKDGKLADIRLTTSDPGRDSLSPLRRAPVAKHVRLLSVSPHYFRGFRSLKSAISLDADLVVFEGSNSSGKTSLVEAIEWLFTGVLSRRASGHPRELANCIANEFRPEDDETWVECELMVDSQPLTIRRVLLQDYSDRATGSTESRVFRDGEALEQSEIDHLFEALFCDVPPILMQHTLRNFVCDTPERRRQYFERLLQVDELTALIEKAVIGDSRLRDFSPNTGSSTYETWVELRDGVGSQAHSAIVRLEREGAATRRKFQSLMVEVAASEFHLAPNTPFLDAVSRLRVEHARDREARFPFLQGLRLNDRNPDVEALRSELSTAAQALGSAGQTLAEALHAARAISAADLAVAQALEALIAVGLIDPDAKAATTCPLCEYEAVATLTESRVALIRQRLPLSAKVEEGKTGLQFAAKAASSAGTKTRTALRLLAPKLPNQAEFEAQIETLDGPAASDARDVYSHAVDLAARVRRIVEALDALSTLYHQPDDVPRIPALLTSVTEEMPALAASFASYVAAFSDLERSLSVLALDDKKYSLRERWLNAADDPEGIVHAIRWQEAKTQAQEALEKIRKGLIELRARIIDDARISFSEQMTEIWRALRRDTASRFSRLSIPSPKGRGFKLEIEVKATLNDGKTDAEVDALKVLSESQINVLCIAAFITRSRLLGHRCLIFDDPVQSMDEDHYRSFAGDLVSQLIDAGNQVLLLTHSEQFARDIADKHYDRLSFVTLRTRASRRQGCQVDEGNRRITERLNRAEQLAEDGRMDEAWKAVRLCLERLYTLAYQVQNPRFDTRTWRGHAAEYMWENGAGSAIEKAAPQSGKRLRDILSMTAAGAHDSAPRGLTDLVDSARYIKSLLTPLRLGAG